MPRRRASKEPAEPLGSVTQQPQVVVPGTHTCLSCGSASLTRIRMTLPSGLAAVFVSCSSCEQTNWFAVEGDGTPLDPSVVLGPADG